MRYPVAIESGDACHAYGIVVPDLPGCISAGDTMDEALANAREAILLHLEDFLDNGVTIPKASAIKKLRERFEFKNWTWATVEAKRK